jgi:hypothetical protein
MSIKRHVIYRTKHLKDQISWTAGLAGVIRLLTWETNNALGISKTQLQQRTLDHVFQSCENDVLTLQKFQKIASTLASKTRAEIEAANVENLYDDPKPKSLINPIEAQRRMRLFLEEFLNKEFDVFMSLLPNSTLTQYLNSHFSLAPECEWSITGTSNDFEESTGMQFMYMDTLAYAHNTSTLVALELKMDSEIGEHQILKYSFMSAYLESKDMIAKKTSFHLLFLSNDYSLAESIPALIQRAQNQLTEKNYPDALKMPEMESLIPRVQELLKSVVIKSTTWQEFGNYFDTLKSNLPVNEYTVTLHKLIDGFLTSLQTKYSRKKKGLIYHRENV